MEINTEPRAGSTGDVEKSQSRVNVEAMQYIKGSYQTSMKFWAYSHPRVQAIMLGCVLFITVGMYNVITFIGGAGQQTAWLSDVANIALYVVFTVFCLIAPACLNYFGLRTTLCFGGFGLLVRCFAAFLWTAEGTAITAFASEEKKGLYVSIFWSIFQFGVVIGAAIPVGQNWNAGTNNGSRIGDGTYIGLFILMLCGAFLGLAICRWHKIIREDGSRVTLEDQETFMEEVHSSWHVTRTNWWIIFLVGIVLAPSPENHPSNQQWLGTVVSPSLLSIPSREDESAEKIPPLLVKLRTYDPSTSIPRSCPRSDSERSHHKEVTEKVFGIDHAGQNDEIVTHPRERKSIDPAWVRRRQL